MPKCLKCGSYYIRAPCPVCSPHARKTEHANQMNSMTAEIASLEDQLQSHEVTKVGINDRIKKLELEIKQKTQI
ncbi:MAG: hypothetical protein ACXADW_24575 [Candidatus Hodarchaeales archaeon]|jgi:septal ring factor EnvC (AmiA/AmiB activator)